MASYYQEGLMLIRTLDRIRYSEITPKEVYLNRRRFLAASTGLLYTAASALANSLPNVQKSPLSTQGEKITPKGDVTTYNNFYEFGTGKGDPSRNAGKLKIRPWKVKVEGLCNKPQTFDIEQLLTLAPMEERVYRHRCVEAWSIVVPWNGYSLSALLKQVEPNAKAKYVAFESYYDPGTMLSPQFAGIDFPYREGLRLDEAMHPLTLLTFGMYGETLPNQDGAPVRLVVPWKYGYKSIKSIVKVRLVEKEPPTTWNLSSSREYGFYSNVNPDVDHPRWSQASERRLGEFLKRKTLMFNGYGDQVAGLYSGMDLKKYH
jgi:sulfoxide reductase catalytic subunit YedY